MLPSTFVPLPPWIITHEQAIQAARELERRETEAFARRDAMTADHSRAKRDKRKAREARRLRVEGGSCSRYCSPRGGLPDPARVPA